MIPNPKIKDLNSKKILTTGSKNKVSPKLSNCIVENNVKVPWDERYMLKIPLSMLELGISDYGVEWMSGWMDGWIDFNFTLRTVKRSLKHSDLRSKIWCLPLLHNCFYILYQ